MKVIRHKGGKAAGRVAIIDTLATMEVGDVWTIRAGQTSLTYAQQACSRYGFLTGRKYWCSSRQSAGGRITIRRDK